MSVDGHRAAMEAYDSAIHAVYGTAREAMVAAAPGERLEPVDDEARLQALVDASQEAGNTARSLLDHEDERLREVGEAQLAALAARDFAIAHDLASRDPDEGPSIAATEDASPVLPEIERSLAHVLGADPQDGLPAAGGGPDEVATLIAADDRAALTAALRKALDSVQHDTRDVIDTGVGKLAGVGAGDLVGQALSHAFEHLPGQVRFWFRWAIDMFNEGLEKLKKLFGGKFDDALKAIKKWIDEHGVDHVLEWAYDRKRIEARLDELVAGASDGKDLAAVGKSVDGVVRKYGTQKQVLEWIFKGLGFVQPFLSKVVPQAAAVVGGALGLGIAYVIYSGGDYVDWYRTNDDGFFDFVTGVRRTAEAALATTA